MTTALLTLPIASASARDRAPDSAALVRAVADAEALFDARRVTLDDIDADGILDADDNCVWTPNPKQLDLDGDLLGDRCDADLDDDGVKNVHDNCPRVPNADQLDVDGDAIGDTCDLVDDYDGFVCWYEHPPSADDGNPFLKCAAQPGADRGGWIGVALISLLALRRRR